MVRRRRIGFNETTILQNYEVSFVVVVRLAFGGLASSTSLNHLQNSRPHKIDKKPN